MLTYKIVINAIGLLISSQAFAHSAISEFPCRSKNGELIAIMTGPPRPFGMAHDEDIALAKTRCEAIEGFLGPQRPVNVKDTSIPKKPKLEFKFSQLVGHKSSSKGFDMTFVSATKDGKLLISSKAGDEKVDVKVISDRRGTDGNLELDLGKGRTLVMSAGFGLDEGVTYTLIENNTQLKLVPVVHLNVSEDTAAR